MAWLPFAALLLAAAPQPQPEPTIHETAAQRLHRKGVRCMDEIERPECAIESFEALVDEDTRERELVTDAMLRLMTLYRRTGREEEIGPLLRRFWDAGGDRESRGHVPYSARFLPTELNMLVNIDPPRVLGSGLVERDVGLGEYMFTCDEVRRHDIEIAHRWRRAEKLAAEQGKQTWEVFYERLDEQREKELERERRRAERDVPEEEPEPPPLVFAVACPLAQALGQTDNRAWRRMTGASHHREKDKSVAIFQLDGLDAYLQEAVAQGRLVPDGPGRWRLPELEYEGLEIRFASLDHDELVAAPLPLLAQMEQDRRKRKRRINRELDKLVEKVPRDTGMFVVLNQAALREMGFGDIERRSLRGFIETILPRPQGLQVAAVFGDSIGMFTRVPTDSAVRGRMLVSLANTMMARGAEGDSEAARWLEGLDVAEASDRKALLASYVVTAVRLEEILWD